MEFLSLANCVAEYKAAFDHLYPEEHQRLGPGRISAGRISAIQDRIGVIFPVVFVDAISKYDFSNLSIQQIFFSYGQNYDQLEIWNSIPGYPWWGAGKRPENLVQVAFTSGWTVLLDVSLGSVTAFENPWTGEAEPIAHAFDVFLRAAFTMVLRNPHRTGSEEEFLRALGIPESEFWKQATRGWV
jgi:hypothetical protein